MNHPGLLQMAKEHKSYLKREDAVECFLVDDSSSDDNMETSDLPNGGIFLFFHLMGSSSYYSSDFSLYKYVLVLIIPKFWPMPFWQEFIGYD